MLPTQRRANGNQRKLSSSSLRQINSTLVSQQPLVQYASQALSLESHSQLDLFGPESALEYSTEMAMLVPQAMIDRRLATIRVPAASLLLYHCRPREAL